VDVKINYVVTITDSCPKCGEKVVVTTVCFPHQIENKIKFLCIGHGPWWVDFDFRKETNKYFCEF